MTTPDNKTCGRAEAVRAVILPEVVLDAHADQEAPTGLSEAEAVRAVILPALEFDCQNPADASPPGGPPANPVAPRPTPVPG